MTEQEYEERRLRALAKIAVKEAEVEGLTEASIEELVSPLLALEKPADGEV